jgi:hypothetical protein
LILSWRFVLFIVNIDIVNKITAGIAAAR